LSPSAPIHPPAFAFGEEKRDQSIRIGGTAHLRGSTCAFPFCAAFISLGRCSYRFRLCGYFAIKIACVRVIFDVC
jgi:hypothetical protein